MTSNKASVLKMGGETHTQQQWVIHTYNSNGSRAQSRIDQIYIKPSLAETAREWKITITGLPNADHHMVSVQIVDQDAPLTGIGR